MQYIITLPQYTLRVLTSDKGQDRQFAYNAASRRFPLTKFLVEGNMYCIICVCVSVTLDIQHVKHMRHIVICGPSGSTIIFHIISQNDTIFRKKLQNTKCVFFLIFSINFFCNISHFVQNIARFYRKYTAMFM